MRLTVAALTPNVAAVSALPALPFAARIASRVASSVRGRPGTTSGVPDGEIQHAGTVSY